MFTLKLDTHNAAFENEDRALEVARILREVADAVETGATSAPVRDINGNTVGRFTLTNR